MWTALVTPAKAGVQKSTGRDGIPACGGMTCVTTMLMLCLCAGLSGQTPVPTAAGSFRVDLPAHRFANDLRPASPFGINTALRPGAKVLGLNMAFCDVRWAETILKAVPFDPVRTKNLSIPLGESPIYIVGPKGLKAELREDPGW